MATGVHACFLSIPSKVCDRFTSSSKTLIAEWKSKGFAFTPSSAEITKASGMT